MQNATDLVNGDTSDPSKLIAAPGADGISLREALLAVNGVVGPHEITFSPNLAGTSVSLSAPLPYILRDGTQVRGVRGANGAPSITLDAAGFTVCCGFATLTIAASGVTVGSLRFANVTANNRALRLLVGGSYGKPPGPPEISDVRVEENVFDNRPRTSTAYAFTLGADHEDAGTAVRNVVITRNTFLHFQGDGTTVHMQGGANSGLIEDVDIYDNVFVEIVFAVELTNVRGSQNQILGTRIVRNSFIGSVDASITLGNSARPDTSPATGNVIARTLIAGNRFTGGRHYALQVNGGSQGATGNAVSETWFVNNIVERGSGGVLVVGGTQGATGNRVDELHVVNNTFYQNAAGIAMLVDDAASGNAVVGLDIRNSIFWAPGSGSADFHNEVTPSLVFNTITQQVGYVGVNGNFDADPLFVAPDAGDFHLQPASLAIDRGSLICAPTTDLECRPRVGLPDLGAFESGPSQNLCPGTLPDFPGSCSAPKSSPRPRSPK